MGFVFRLERVLRLRLKERDEAAIKNALAARMLNEAREALAALEGELDDTEALLDRIKRADQLDGETLHYHRLHCVGLAMDIRQAEYQVMKCNEEVALAAQLLIEAHKASEILEKLKEHEVEEWRQEEHRKEVIKMDEVAVSGFRKKEVSK